MKLYSTENSEPVAGFWDRSINRHFYALPYVQIYSNENVEEPIFLLKMQIPD
jgi:hypothetical protein